MRAMKVVFLAPSYPPEMQQYTRGLAEVGAEVYGVGDSPVHALPPSLRPYLHDYLQVPRLLADLADAERLVGVAVHAVQERGHIHIDDVTILDEGGVRDAVADDLVEAGAT